jgi:hypothetical protein
MATMPSTNINIPYSSFIDSSTGRPTQAWLLWLMSPDFIRINLSSALAVTSGGTGLTTIPTNGQLLIGNGTGYTLNTLGTGVGISVTNGSGTITVANTGVLSNIAGTGISVSSATGNVTIANTGVLSFSGGTTGLTPATATAGTVALAGTLVIANGGTNGSATPTAYGVAYGTGTAYAFTAAGTTGQVLTATTGSAPTWAAPATSGTVTSVSVVSANGFAGTVATATSTPAITLTTSITGVLKGNGTAISAATVNTDYFAPSAPVTKTANFSVADTEVWLINNKSGSTCTVTLPTASSWSGRVLRFLNYQAQTVVSASSNVVPLAGGAAGTSILLASTGDSATLVSDGSNWLMTQYIPNNILLLE